MNVYNRLAVEGTLENPVWVPKVQGVMPKLSGQRTELRILPLIAGARPSFPSIFFRADL
jgi:hypothetical protein